MKRLLVATALAGGLLSGFALTAAAEETNPNIVHRQGIYKLAAGHMTAMKAILFLGLDAKDHLSWHAQGLQQAFAHHKDPFPAGTDKGETKAKPEIWSKNEEFKAAGKKAGEAVGKLVEATKGTDMAAITAAYKDVGAACKNCHDSFRKE